MSVEKTIKVCIDQNIPVMLVWETWIWKTTAIKNIAKENYKDLVRVNLNWQTGIEELLWKYILKDWNTIWIDWTLTRAMKTPDTWILLDEFNAALPEVLFALQSLIETNDWKLGEINLLEKDWEIVKPLDWFRLFATMNPSTYNYWWTKDMNKATMSRFVVINFQQFDPDTEYLIVSSKFEWFKKYKLLKEIINTTNTARELYTSWWIDHYISTRDIIMTMSLIQWWISTQDAIEYWIINKASSEETMSILKEIYSKFYEQQPYDQDTIVENKDEPEPQQQWITWSQIKSIVSIFNKSLLDAYSTTSKTKEDSKGQQNWKKNRKQKMKTK